MAATGRAGWLRGIVFDCRDHEALADFWSTVLDVGIYKELPGWKELAPGKGNVVLGFQPATGAPAPQGRIRLDVEVDDLDEGQAALEAAGATFVRSVHFTEGEEHRIMADPEGNEFNIVLPFPEGW